ncbi:MAG: hypothetical protein R3F33_08450 [Planctomycetota bacterium]
MFAILVAAALAAWYLDLSWRGLLPRGQGLALWRRFFAAALRPAFDYEGSWRPADGPPFLWVIVQSLFETCRFALASMGLALVFGLALGIFASRSFWTKSGESDPAGWRRLAWSGARALATLLRSVHELLWALVLLAAIGLGETAALLALTLPFTGILAKIFSEQLEEAPGGASLALEAAGSPRARALLVGRLPLAWPDMAAYAFYRFECAVRSSAVLGFFGFPTFGYHLELSYHSLHYREVWTQLYALAMLVWVLERWSTRLRSRGAF